MAIVRQKMAMACETCTHIKGHIYAKFLPSFTIIMLLRFEAFGTLLCVFVRDFKGFVG